METPRPVSERSFVLLLQQAVAAGAAGLVALRDREGLRHGVWVQQGYVVGVYVAGRFDPLLELLRREGLLDARAHRRCLDQLQRGASRCGAVASELAGIERARIVEALRLQVVARFTALLEIAARDGFDAVLERRPIPADEVCVHMPLGSLLRRAARLAPAATHARDRARSRLRALAHGLHPDLHSELDPAARLQLTRELARATADYHGLS